MNGFYYYGFDSLYILLVIPAIIIALWAQIRVKTAFSKYSKISCSASGADAARRVLESNGVYNVKIERVSGELTDHYDPKTNTIRLSEAVFSVNSIAAVGVAAHEAGHAVQYAKGYAPIKLRAAILPICSIGSKLSVPLILLGLVFSFSFLIDLGIIFFILAIIFQLITLPVEFNASNRAMHAIESNFILTDEIDRKGAKSVLSAAAMTYVAAVIVSFAQLLRLLAISNRKR